MACSTSPEAEALRQQSMNTVEHYTDKEPAPVAALAQDLKQELGTPETFDARMEERLDTLDEAIAEVDEGLPSSSAQHVALDRIEQETDAARFELTELSAYEGDTWKSEALALRVSVKDLEQRVQAMQTTL
ncbi:MAG: hypothetical protein H6741_01610 [Alphaproteobacteria bacterium]|nr:hypothetical protein [Alphaproteobacteria bacterium]